MRTPDAQPPTLPTIRLAGDPQVSPLTPEHIRQIALARSRTARIRRAVRVARFSGWTMCILGGLAVLTSGIGLLWVIQGDWSSLPGFTVGLAIVACGVNEMRAGSSLHRLVSTAPARLALNQLWIALALVGYSAAQLVLTRNAPSALASMPTQGDPAIDGLIHDLRDLESWVRVGLYVTVAVVAVVFSLCTAFFYLRRRGHLAAYRAETPGWIISLQEAGAL